MEDLALKNCSSCKQTKPLTEFYGNRRFADGKHTCCKQCAADYTKENVRVISRRANRIKSDASLAELIELVLYVARASS